MDEVLCASCGSSDIETKRKIQTFPYGKGEKLVYLKAVVDVHTCFGCSFSFTDWKAEKARTSAVEKYLENSKQLERNELPGKKVDE